MNGQHTPGPWVIEDPEASECEIIAPDGDEEPWYIARVYDGASGEESIVNARLIAAAPELLEALEKTTEIAVCFANCGKAEATGGKLPQWLVDARAAIAKARGETT